MSRLLSAWSRRLIRSSSGTAARPRPCRRASGTAACARIAPLRPHWQWKQPAARSSRGGPCPPCRPGRSSPDQYRADCTRPCRSARRQFRYSRPEWRALRPFRRMPFRRRGFHAPHDFRWTRRRAHRHSRRCRPPERPRRRRSGFRGNRECAMRARIECSSLFFTLLWHHYAARRADFMQKVFSRRGELWYTD